MNKEERIEYLEDERKKIWEKILILEDQISKKTSDYETVAKLASEESVIFKNTSEESKNLIFKALEESNSKLEELKISFATHEELVKKIIGFSELSDANYNLIKTIYENLESKSASITTQISEIERIFTNLPTLEANNKTLNDILIRSNENDSKINTLYEAITSKKKEIDDLYYQIVGVTELDKTTGTEIHTPGLRDELESAYTQIKSKLDETGKELLELKTKTELGFTALIDDRNKEFSANLNKWNSEFNNVQGKITELLPNALTVGLSFAYAEKKEAEEKDSKRLLKTFYFAIAGLIIVSLIPFAISIKSIFENTPFEQVVFRVPRLILAILPLYIPVLWVAYSSNKKLNLSKRLIEEYSHKEVISKTFEGLSKQFKDVDDKETSSDLKIRLLYNILEVNSENPGKLISDYDKSDHPLMDTLEKSIKLTNAFTKLSKIPGLSKLATKLSKQSEAVLAEESKKAAAGLDSITT